jgi:subtilisin family serine protease
MANATLLYHKSIGATARLIESEPTPQTPIFDPAPGKPDELNAARFLATFLPVDDWWILGVERPPPGKPEDEGREKLLERLTHEFFSTQVTARGVTAAEAIARRYGAGYIEDPSEPRDRRAADREQTDEVPEGILAVNLQLEAPLPKIAPNAVVNPAGDRLYGHQSYLHASDFGINIEEAWKHVGGDGATVALALVDEGWNQDHDDLKGKKFTSFGFSDPASAGHGTAVLGVICASQKKGSAKGEALGIVPGLSDIFLSSYRYLHNGTTRSGLKMKAIAWAAWKLWELAMKRSDPNRQYGDVLVVETQTKVGNLLVPEEIDIMSYAAIRAAVAAGIVVVEPGGNGGSQGNGHADFDDFLMWRRSPQTKKNRIEFPLAPNRPGYRDSGAIIVSAVNQDVPHRRLFFAPLGNRIDVCAPGAQITTCDAFLDNPNDPKSMLNDRYQAGFAGTSGAAAIIGGVVASLQGIRDGAGEPRLWPEDVRELLKERGILCFDDRTNSVMGRMPNMAALIDADCPPRGAPRTSRPPRRLRP